jgi:hypothetical protein
MVELFEKIKNNIVLPMKIFSQKVGQMKSGNAI